MIIVSLVQDLFTLEKDFSNCGVTGKGVEYGGGVGCRWDQHNGLSSTPDSSPQIQLCCNLFSLLTFELLCEEKSFEEKIFELKI